MAEPTFDTWTSLFLIASVQGFFIAFVLFNLRKSNKANIWLAFLVLTYALINFQSVLYWTNYILHLPHLNGITNGFVLLLGPFLYFYLRQTYYYQPFSWQRDGLHFLPFIIVYLYYFPYLLKTTDEKIVMLTKGVRQKMWQYRLTFYGFPTAEMLSLVVYTIVSYLQFNVYGRLQKTIKIWFLTIVSLFAGIAAAIIAYYLMVWTKILTTEWDYFISLCIVLFIYFIAFMGYKQPSVFNGFGLLENQPNQNGQKYRTSVLTENAAKELAERLNAAMIEKQWYLENDLSLDRLAELLGTSKHNLSQVLNETMGMSFFDYINQLRIADALKLLTKTSKEDLNIIEIAYRVGYNNKATFNATFKKIVGKTPSEFRKEQQTKDN